ncbi:unnamed protein product, partial [Lymnaea stagnalis]
KLFGARRVDNAMQEWIADWLDVAWILVAMGISTCILVRLAQILAGISEIEEAHASQDSTGNQGNGLDPTHLQASPDCMERVRASRSPVRPQTKQRKAPRRSLSLPSGGLSYGDVKILYKDGHFVTVGAPSERASSEKQAGEDMNASQDSNLENAGFEGFRKRNLSSSVKEVNEDYYDQDGNMRAEILSLLENGITDSQQLLAEAALALDYNCNRWEEGDLGRRTRAGAPIFLSLPRRRQKGHRPASVDEVHLLKLYSRSQQSLVSSTEMERRRREQEADEEGGRVNEGSTLKRNKSFTEAMGSNLMLNETERGGDAREIDCAELCDSGFDDNNQRLARDDSQSRKSRSKGPGFLQRMLKKGKGSTSDKPLSLSSKPSKEDLSASSLSLVSQTSTTSASQPTSPNKRDGKDSSLTRKMSFRGIFKRKSSTDLTVKKSSPTPEESEGPPLAAFLHNDDIGTVSSPPASAQRRLLRNIGETDLLEDDVSNIDEYESLSQTSSRSRSPRTPLSNSSSHSSLYYSVGCEDNDKTPTADYGPVVHRRVRGSSGRSRYLGSARLSGDSFSEYDFSSSEFQSSEDTLTPRSFSPCIADVSAEGERTLVPSPASPGDGLSPPIYQKLTSSPQGGRRRRSKDSAVSPQANHGVDRGEITSSNSNDSGIQNDANITSSAESIQATVKLRKSKSPSPVAERPKSDITVRWADLLEQVMETGAIRYRRDASKLRKRPRPKSDIGRN